MRCRSFFVVERATGDFVSSDSLTCVRKDISKALFTPCIKMRFGQSDHK